MRCFASTTAAPLLSYTSFPRSWPPDIPPIPWVLGGRNPRARAVVRAPALCTGGALAMALAPTLVFVVLLWPRLVLVLELKLFLLTLKVLAAIFRPFRRPHCSPLPVDGHCCSPLPANGRCCSPLLAVGQFPPANSLPVALSHAEPSSGVVLPSYVLYILIYINTPTREPSQEPDQNKTVNDA